MSAAYLKAPAADNAAQEAIGAVEAQRLIESVSTGNLTPAHAWLRFCDLASKHGWKSAACRSLVCELLKRAAR